MDNKCSIKIIITIIAVLMLSNIVFAFAVTSDYHSNAPMNLARGESKGFSIVLQNMVGGKDLSANVEILEGKEFVSLVGKNNVYEVPYGKKDIYVNFKASVSEQVAPGEYNVSIFFRTKEKTLEEGTVQFGVGSEIRFKLIVGDAIKVETKESFLMKNSVLLIVLGVIVLAVVVLFVLIRKRNNGRPKK